MNVGTVRSVTQVMLNVQIEQDFIIAPVHWCEVTALPLGKFTTSSFDSLGHGKRTWDVLSQLGVKFKFAPQKIVQRRVAGRGRID